MQSIKLLLAGFMVSGIMVGLTTYAAERDPLAPRVPPDQMAAAKAWKNPYQATPANIAKGKELYQGKGTCFTCHGNEGKGDGPAGAALDPSPRNFHNPKFDQVKTPGEIMWVIKNGIPGTGMIAYAPGSITEDEAALVTLFELSLGKQP